MIAIFSFGVTIILIIDKHKIITGIFFSVITCIALYWDQGVNLLFSASSEWIYLELGEK